MGTNLSPAKYKVLLKKLAGLRAAGGSNAFQRAGLLRQLLNDEAFWRDHTTERERRIVLDKHCSDLCIGPFELARMVELFPNRRRWENTPLDKLWKLCVAKDRRKRGESDADVPVRRRSRDQVIDALQSELKTWQDRYRALEKEHNKLLKKLRLIDPAANKESAA